MSGASEESPPAPGAVYRDGLARGELLYQRCERCAAAVFYPRVLCPHCGGAALSWRRSSGRGLVYATTTVRARAGSHNVSLVDLEEGFRMMCRVEGRDDVPVRIGDPVDAVVPDGAVLEDVRFVVRAAQR